MEVKDGLKYTKDHEWALLEASNQVRVGITDYAQHELGDVVFVDLPQIGNEVSPGQSMLTVESVKAVSDVYSPIHGKILAVNSTLEQNPERVNEDPFGSGWIVIIEATNLEELTASGSAALLDAEQYRSYLAEIAK